MAILGSLSKKDSGVLPYLLLLLGAIIVLFYISYTSFEQNRALRGSTELVSKTQDIINEINLLFGSYSSSEASGVKYLISNDSTYLSPIQGFSDKSTKSLNTLKELMADNKEQLSRLEKIPSFSDRLFEEISAFDKETAELILQSNTLRERVNSIEGYLDSLQVIQQSMIEAELAMLKERKKAYASEVTLTPTNILYLALFALGTLMFAFTKINSDRKRIALTQDFLQSVLENTNTLVNYVEPVTDNDGKIEDFAIIYANSKAANFSGFEKNQVLGKTIYEIYPFAEQENHIEFLKEIYAKKETVERIKCYDKDGDAVWFDSTFTTLGQGMTITSRDITQEKKSALKLKELNDQLESQNLELAQTSGFLQNLVSSLQYIVSYFESVRDESGKVTDFKIAYTNDKIQEFIGSDAESIADRLVSEVYPQVFENGDFETFVEVINSGEPKEEEKSYQLQEGQFVFCNEIAKLEDGVTVVSQDITLRKQAESQLQLSKQALEVQNTILQDAEKVAGIGSYNWNVDTGKMEYSDNAYRLFGYEPGEFEPSYEKFLSFVNPADARRLKSNTEKAIKEKKEINDKFRVKTKDGTTKYISSVGHSIEKDGESYRIGVIRDITAMTKNEQDLKVKNRALKRSNSELESFNRVASHDLQEPLRKIQMFISRLSNFDKKNLSEKGQKYLEKIENSANRMQLLIRNLLSYSRIADEIEKKYRVDLNIIFDKVKEDLAIKIIETDAQISVPDLPSISGIEFQLEQLFNNLLSNAIKYKKHDQTPEITVTSEIRNLENIEADLNLTHPKYLYLTVSDNGIGFEQEQSDKIFELFERLHAKHAYTGTGLGLAICKKIVENHQGHISATSEPGQGTTIKIYLPYRN